MKETMLKRITYFSGQKSELVECLKRYFTDISFSLEDRWDVFSEATSSGVYDHIHNWVWHSSTIEDILGLNWYDDLYTERYQTRHFIDVIEMLEDREDYGTPITKDQIDAIKEEMLKSGYTGFIFDW